jgi:predicted 3-demethylubiquinone-9 3-methyltransferase (glyoxalase superfamily)
MEKIATHLWFDRSARDAVQLYTAAFENSRVISATMLADTPSGTVEVVLLELAGQEFQLLFAGPEFKFTPAVSFLVACSTYEETEALWKRLSEGGSVLMEFGAYPFSEAYGWTQDRYGLSWQVMLVKGREIQQKITPSLMFTGANCGKAEDAMRFYASVFPDSSVDHVVRYGAGEDPEREGTVKHASFRLAGQRFAAIESARAHSFTFNEAISLVVHCATQAELDHYWGMLSADPRAEQCGWLKDRYGLSWQIVPDVMSEMLKQGSREQIAHVTRAFLQMKKFDIAALKRAYEGE